MSQFLGNPNVNFKYSTILKKKFRTNLSGYDALEVDAFFDKIIEDYQMYENHFNYLSQIINEKIALINDKEEIIEEMKVRLNALEERVLYLTKASSNQFIIKEIEDLKKQINSKNVRK